MMTLWLEDLSTCSFEEIVRSQAENRAWNKELRLQSSVLVKSRLAKTITLEEYAANRKRFQEDAAECSRRAVVLSNEINSRAIHSAPR
jgi:hypothetical protein